MNRRLFLQSLSLGVGGMILDPELALWVPGRKTIFLPSVARFDGIVISGIILDELSSSYLNSRWVDSYYSYETALKRCNDITISGIWDSF